LWEYLQNKIILDKIVDQLCIVTDMTGSSNMIHIWVDKYSKYEHLETI
jgi:hypothetical protein